MSSNYSMLNIIHPQNNGVHFLSSQGPDSKLSSTIIHSILDQYNIQRGWSHPSGFPVNSPMAMAYNNLPPPPSPLQNTMVHVADILNDDPHHLYLQLANAFSIPEYYGYSIETLQFFLTDLSWLHAQHGQPPNHVLLLNISPTSSLAHTPLSPPNTLLPPSHSFWLLLNQISLFWQSKGIAFISFVVLHQPSSTSALETPRL